MINRRRFLRTSLVGGAALAAPGALSNLISARAWSVLAQPLLDVAAGETLITILHTNDMHSQIDPIDHSDKQYGGKGGVARRATLVQRVRKENPNTLLIDAGDVFQGTPYFNFYKGEVEYKAMSLIGYDVGTIGNHDFDNGVAGLVSAMKFANFDFVSANYDFRGTPLETRVKPYVVHTLGNVRIGLFGLVFDFLFWVGGMMISLAGKAALITGGSRGIGAAAVKLFAQAGADVVFNYNKAKDAADQVQQEAGKHGTRVEAFKADVGRHADNKKLVDFAVSRLGRLDIVVANAGVWNLEDLPVEKMSEKQWEEMIRVNLTSVYSIIHFSVPQMIKQKSGKIIPISSTAGQRGESFHTHYGASKGGIISFAKGLASELARHNILVNCVAPGWVATDMSNPVINSKTGGKAIAAAIPLRRAGTAEEIAGPILFLASDLANFMTGEIINVNGGAVLCG